LLGWRACPPAQLITWRPQPALESLEPQEPLASLKSLELLEPWGSQTLPLKPLKPLELRKPLPPLEPLEPPGRESLRSIVETFGLQVPYGLGEGNDTLFKHRFLPLFLMVGQNLSCEFIKRMSVQASLNL
jgi:hypothetical protein